MKKMILWAFLIIVFLCCAGVFYLSYLAGEWPASPQHPPQRDFSTDALLLSEEDLGAPWKMTQNYRREGSGGLAAEGWNREFQIFDDHGDVVAVIEHWVIRFTNSKRASNYFRSEYETYLDSVYVLPEKSFFQPRYADRAVLRPYVPGSFIAIYEEYLIGIGIRSEGPDVDANKYVSEEQAISWFRKIDERAGRLLGRMP